MKKFLQVGLCSGFLSAVLSTASFTANAYYFPRVATLTNDLENNELMVFAQLPGQQGLKLIQSIATGGTGLQAALGNQDGLIVSEDGNYLYAINPGSDSLSVFAIKSTGVELIQTVSSQGIMPLSLTQNDDLLFVLNGGSDSIAGFSINSDGTLAFIDESLGQLSSTGTAPAQVSFTPDGAFLIVTEKVTGVISTFPVTDDGVIGERAGIASEKPFPFGFDFDRFGHVLVSEANPFGTDGGSVTSYNISASGNLELLDSAELNGQRATCWLKTGKGGRFAYVSNTFSETISLYSVDRDGDLVLTGDDGLVAELETGDVPIDIAFSDNGRIFYVLNEGNDGSIASYQVTGAKGLRLMDRNEDVPAFSTGIVAF
ncbi:lactonase family protein [Sessilibacter sp. MAH4]